MKNFKYMEWGGPGHLSMMFIGLKTGKSTMLLYPDDTAGKVRFAIAGDNGAGEDGIMRIMWQNRDYVTKGENYSAGNGFRLYLLGDSGLSGIASEYRKWAEKQPWMTSWKQKLRNAPVAKQALNGVIKMTAFEAIGKDGGKYADKEFKEKNCKILTYTYKRFLEVARKIEKTYKVKPAYRYDGWWGRFDSRYPEYFPVDKELGDFAEFIASNNKENRLVFLHVNPIQWDSDTKSFDIDKMSKSYTGKPCVSIWSRNKLYFCSPLLVIKDEVAAEKKIISYGVRGLFEDVIGCTTMIDCNPKAGYKSTWRENGTQALIKLSGALRKAMPGVFRGTEGGMERMLPDYDAFMMGTGSPADGVPLFNMVYGDCYANMEGIGGGANGANHIARSRAMLFGMVLGLDGRYRSWVNKYNPRCQMIFETQKVMKQTVGTRILNYTNQGDIYLSQRKDAIVCANLGKNSCDKITFNDTTMGKLEIKSLLPGGAVMVSKNGTFVSWGCLKTSVNDKLLFDVNGPESMVVCYDGTSVVAANGMSKDFAAADIKLDIPSVDLKGQAIMRPDDKNIGVSGLDGKWLITIPANKVIYIK